MGSLQNTHNFGGRIVELAALKLLKPSLEDLTVAGVLLGGLVGPFVAMIVSSGVAFLPVWLAVAAAGGFAARQLEDHPASCLLQPAAIDVVGAFFGGELRELAKRLPAVPHDQPTNAAIGFGIGFSMALGALALSSLAPEDSHANGARASIDPAGLSARSNGLPSFDAQGY